MKKRAALLVRCSSEKQDYQRQISDLLAFVGDRYLVNETDIYADQISGYTKNDDRPELNRLMKNIETNAIQYDMIFCQEVSRLGRNPKHSRELVEWLMEMNVPLFIQNLGLCTFKEGGQRNEIFSVLFTVMAEAANTEAQNIKMRSISGTRQKIKQGHAGSGSFLPYGYKRDTNKMLVIDNEEAKVVRFIYEQILAGVGSSSICRMLNDKGIKTRAQKAVKKGFLRTKHSNIVIPISSIRWCQKVILDMARNPIYKGKRRWKGLEGLTAPIIINETIWSLVQEELRKRYTNRSLERRYNFCLKHLLKCGCCGRNMVGRYKAASKERSNNAEEYYNCSSTRFQSCENRGINIEKIESAVFYIVKYQRELFEMIKNSDSYLDGRINDIRKSEIEIRYLTKDLKEVEKEAARLLNLHLKGKISEINFDTLNGKLKKSIHNKTEKVLRLKMRVASMKRMIKKRTSSEAVLSVIDDLKKDRIQIKQVFNALIDKVIVTAVHKHSNNTEHIVSVFFKAFPKPVTLYLIGRRAKKKVIVDFTGKTIQNNFKFMYVSYETQVDYTEDGVLINDCFNLVQQAKEYNTDEMDGFEFWEIPELIKFDAKNMLSAPLDDKHVRELKEAS